MAWGREGAPLRLGRRRAGGRHQLLTALDPVGLTPVVSTAAPEGVSRLAVDG